MPVLLLLAVLLTLNTSVVRGEPLSWDQLEFVATETGIGREKIEELKLKARAEQLIGKYHLPLEISGFSKGMNPDEEFRLFRGQRPGQAALLLNTNFWSKNAPAYDNDAFLTYLLFRAEAYYTYRSHFDSAHGAWIVEEESPSMEVLKSAIDGASTEWVVDEGPPSDRDLEFRRTFEPSKALNSLVDYALRAIAQKASDDWANARYQQTTGPTPPVVTEKIRQRERALAADFHRARCAMTRSERLAFEKLLKSPFRYTRTKDQPASEPVYDPAVETPH